MAVKKKTSTAKPKAKAASKTTAKPKAKAAAKPKAKPAAKPKAAAKKTAAKPKAKANPKTRTKKLKTRYSDKELEEFRKLINEKLEEAHRDYDMLKSSLSLSDDHGTDDTSPTFKMMEDGSETLTKEETAQLAGRQEKFIKHLENALIRIENKSYGICRETGKLINKERLKLVPHATLSIEAKQRMNK